MSEKIRKVLEAVAPMRKKKLNHTGKPRWMSGELEDRINERTEMRKTANSTKLMKDE